MRLTAMAEKTRRYVLESEPFDSTSFAVTFPLLFGPSGDRLAASACLAIATALAPPVLPPSFSMSFASSLSCVSFSACRLFLSCLSRPMTSLSVLSRWELTTTPGITYVVPPPRDADVFEAAGFMPAAGSKPHFREGSYPSRGEGFAEVDMPLVLCCAKRDQQKLPCIEQRTRTTMRTRGVRLGGSARRAAHDNRKLR